MTKCKFTLLRKIKQKRPLILLVANSVTVRDVANGISLLGGSPLVTEAVDEVDDLVELADAICINLGTINPRQEKIITAVLQANLQYQKPIVLDPVACGSSQYRLRVAEKIIKSGQLTCIRGNAGEIASLLHQKETTHGIDSGIEVGDVEQNVEIAANKFKCLVMATGASDYVSDGYPGWITHFTSPNFTKWVGTGDMLSAICATFLAIEESISSLYTAVVYFTICGEMTKKDGIASWFIRFTDLLGTISEEQLCKYYEERKEND